MAASPPKPSPGNGTGTGMEQTTFRRILNTGLTGHDPRQAEQGYVRAAREKKTSPLL